jgi:hypothetical protein
MDRIKTVAVLDALSGLNEERCGLYWAEIGPVRLDGRDATRALL